MSTKIKKVNAYQPSYYKNSLKFWSTDYILPSSYYRSRDHKIDKLRNIFSICCRKLLSQMSHIHTLSIVHHSRSEILVLIRRTSLIVFVKLCESWKYVVMCRSALVVIMLSRIHSVYYELSKFSKSTSNPHVERCVFHQLKWRNSRYFNR